jgi:hypothetical protein
LKIQNSKLKSRSDFHPWSGDAAVAAAWTAARRVKGSALENEIARFTARRSQFKPRTGSADAAVDVTKIFLEHPHGQPEIMSEIVKLPLRRSESLDNFLATGEAGVWSHVLGVAVGDGGLLAPPSASHWRTGIPSTQRSSITPPHLQLRELTKQPLDRSTAHGWFSL